MSLNIWNKFNFYSQKRAVDRVDWVANTSQSQKYMLLNDHK